MKLLVAVLATLLLTVGAAQANVRCVQDFLLETAFDPGPADGAWGKRTALALEAYFAQIGETVDGGLGKNNTDAICALFSGPRHEELLELGLADVRTLRGGLQAWVEAGNPIVAGDQPGEPLKGP